MPDLTGQYGGGYSAENPEPADLDAATNEFALLKANWRHMGGIANTGLTLVAELRKLREENARLEDVILQRNAARDVGEIEATERLTNQVKTLVDKIEALPKPPEVGNG